MIKTVSDSSEDILKMKGKKFKKPRGKKGIMIEAMESQLGVVAPACKQAGISRDTHYRWLREDEGYAYFINQTTELTHDFVENALLKQIKEGNHSSTQFYLKTKAKERGYIEKKEIEHMGNINAPVIFQQITKSAEDIKEEIKNERTKEDSDKSKAD